MSLLISSQGRREVSFELLRPPDRRSTFHAVLLEATRDQIVLAHEAHPSKPLRYRGQEVLASGYWAVWFLLRGEPFDIARFYRPNGSWTGYYVDVLEPVYWDGDDPDTLHPIVDLFLDIWIAPDGSFTVLDEDEFDDAIRLGYLSQERSQSARATLETLTTAICQGRFPPARIRQFVL